MVLKKIFESQEDNFYVVFRVIVGLMFFQHGAQKLLGWFTSRDPVAAMTLFWVAGIIELFGGLAIAAGVFTRLVALIAATEMVVAFFKAHIPNGLVPIMNKGEPAVLFFAAFLILLVHGARKFSLERALIKKEIF